jgi:hypothetical protein
MRRDPYKHMSRDQAAEHWYRHNTRVITCVDCGKQERRGIRAKPLCRECLKRRQRPARRRRQQERRATAAGTMAWKVIKLLGVKYPAPVDFACAHCGGMFRPRRKTARYCSPRCRVAAYRARQ